jgi:hypothetical protein
MVCLAIGIAGPLGAVKIIGPRVNGQCGLWVFGALSLGLFSTIMLILTALALDDSAARLLKPPRARRRDRYPNKLRFLARSFATDGKFDEAIRWQTEAIRRAAADRKALFQAELDQYQLRKLPPAGSV